MKEKQEITPGKLIKQACNEKNITLDELYEKMMEKRAKNKKKSNLKITKKTIKYWLDDKDFPDLDMIYDLAEILDLNPNELLETRNILRDSGVKKINPATRRLSGKVIDLAKPMVKVIVALIEIIAAIIVAVSIKTVVPMIKKTEYDLIEKAGDRDIGPYLEKEMDVKELENKESENSNETR